MRSSSLLIRCQRRTLPSTSTVVAANDSDVGIREVPEGIEHLVGPPFLGQVDSDDADDEDKYDDLVPI